MTTTHPPSIDWRERAVTRSLDRARVRAEDRLERLLAAADEMMSEGTEITVQEVVVRAGQSLRTFYQHFAGKHDLLLALLESGCDELAVALERRAARESEPVAALREGVAVLHKASRSHRSHKRRALAQFSAQLLYRDPAAYQQVQQRMVLALSDLVAAAAPADPDPLRTASLVLNIIEGTSRRDALLAARGLAPVTLEELWSAVLGLLHPSDGVRAA
jgi:AcrR family transcriptional regulator